MSWERQKELFEKIHDAYTAHYFSRGSLHWKRQLLWRVIESEKIPLSGARVAEFFCGSGFNSLEILSNYSVKEIQGFDLSQKAVDDFKRNTGHEAFQCDLSVPLSPREPYDQIFVFGGLHHAYFLLPQVKKNLEQALKPGGNLIIYEPLNNTVWEALRRLWYKKDAGFFDASSEHSLVPEEVESENLKLKRVHYITGPGYLFVYNSLILRVPVWAANLLSIPLSFIDRMLSALQIRYFSFCFLAIYQKK